VRSGVEECDDGNTNNGDGCDSNCQNEPEPPPSDGGCPNGSGGTCCIGSSEVCDGCSASGTCSANDAFCGGPGDNRRRCGGAFNNSVGCCL
jgi:cysteine-rich repeat protein